MHQKHQSHQSDKSAITTLLEHLVRMPTISGDLATNSAALDWVEAQLTNLPLQIKRLEYNGVPTLIATTIAVTNPKAPRLWLAGHMDVVPGDPDVFNPKLNGNRLYGRGTSDMKSALAVFIYTLQQLGSSLHQYDLGLMITSDEEVGGFDGARWLVESGYRGQAMILPDGGTNWDIELKAKGIIWYQITATGTSAHASRLWLGDNAIGKLTQFLAAVADLYPAEPCSDPDHAHSTMNIGTIAGGTAANQVAERAIAHIDIRLVPGELISTRHQEITDLANAFPGIEITRLVAEPAFELRSDGALQLFADIAAQITGHKLSSTLSHASSDARHFVAAGIQVITTRSTGGDHHSDQEWIDLDDLTIYYQILRRFIEEWAKI
ncbi:M20/M25/M40 family metallo-hydrolase [bacterium]|nr:MAG: M20/M25/M40 family metallo-hydrolase [bacterium]